MSKKLSKICYVALTAMIFGLPLNTQAQPDTRIIGGHDVPQGTTPWMAALTIRGMNPVDGQYCDATLVASQYVLTAAHCVDGADVEGAVDVFLGSNNLRDPAALKVPALGAIIHPDWDPFLIYNDLALIKLTQPVNLQPMDILTPAEEALLVTGDAMQVYGWGMTDPQRPILPFVLQRGDVGYFTPADCEELLGRYFNRDVNVCAGVLASSPGGGVDSCFGDSGGPLTRVVSNTPRLTGIVSWGFQCGGSTPGVYTRASAYRDWILSFPPIPPSSYDSATIDGPGFVGAQLTCQQQNWKGESLTFSYRWLRDVFDPISGYYNSVEIATGQTYSPVADDYSNYISCEVTAANQSGHSTQTSNALYVDAEPTPVPTPIPDVSAPTVEFLAARCGKSICRAFLAVSDFESGVADVLVKAKAKQPKRNGGIQSLSKNATVLFQGGSLWKATFPRFKGQKSNTIEIRAVDNAGNFTSHAVKAKVTY